MSVQATSEEQEQILQTIEMFEVITQANPQDCQSLEILKEAYWKVGRHEQALTVTRQLADSYYAVGQFSSALLEYEGILQKRPDSPEIVQILSEVEAKLSKITPDSALQAPAGDASLDLDPGAIDDATLMTTNATRRSEHGKSDLSNDGNGALAKFLIQHRLAGEELVNNALKRVQQENDQLRPGKIARSLIDELVAGRSIEQETILCGILDRTKFAYVPLECYDVDRQIVKMLPEDLTLRRLIVPFDLISRTVMVAMANPFDAQGKEAAQQLFDYNIQWHVASPEAITKVLRDTYKIQ